MSIYPRPQRPTPGMRVIRSHSKGDDVLVVGRDIDQAGDPLDAEADSDE